jgi:hypothetical protein
MALCSHRKVDTFRGGGLSPHDVIFALADQRSKPAVTLASCLIQLQPFLLFLKLTLLSLSLITQ